MPKFWSWAPWSSSTTRAMSESSTPGTSKRGAPGSGSANWTRLSRSHLEVGLWVDDPQLVSQAAEFVCGLIALSEPFRSTAILPNPDVREWEPDYEMWGEMWGEMQSRDEEW